MTAKKEAKSKPELDPKDWRTKFLRAFEKSGIVSHAAAVAGVSRTHVYRTRQDDVEFAQGFEEAAELATGHLEAEAVRRGRDGVLRPIFHAGKKCGEVREYSDTLLIFLLKARDPARFRENSRLELAGDPANPLQVTGTINVIEEIERLRPAIEDVADRTAPTTEESSSERI